MNAARDAAAAARSQEDDLPARLGALRLGVLSFIAEGHFIEISARDALNRFFTLCQQAQRVPQSLELLQRTVADIDATVQAGHHSDLARRQHDSLDALRATQDAMIATQNKVEWIEVFVVSFYVAEAVEL